MERGSDKHSPRVDDAMESDVSGLLSGGHEVRAEEFREQEGPAEGEPTPDALVQTGRSEGAGGFSLSHDELERRTELARHLRPSVFPARPGELVETATKEHAPDWVVSELDTLPNGLYDHFEAVWEALGGDEDYPRA
jgi:hypothetical protein